MKKKYFKRFIKRWGFNDRKTYRQKISDAVQPFMMIGNKQVVNSSLDKQTRLPRDSRVNRMTRMERVIREHEKAKHLNVRKSNSGSNMYLESFYGEYRSDSVSQEHVHIKNTIYKSRPSPDRLFQNAKVNTRYEEKNNNKEKQNRNEVLTMANLSKSTLTQFLHK